MTVFGGKLGKNAQIWHFLARFARMEVLTCSLSAENKMSFEIHVTTIATGSLSFGLKNR